MTCMEEAIVLGSNNSQNLGFTKTLAIVFKAKWHESQNFRPHKYGAIHYIYSYLHDF